jgi:molybdopterin-biosynthesis enzyme MoeA-like protein
VEVTEFFKSRGRELTELNRLQAALPTACEKITNPVGTARGCISTGAIKFLCRCLGYHTK